MNIDTSTTARIVRMRLPDITAALAILEENELESWKYIDFVSEIHRNNPLLLVGKINSNVISFCVARLIIPTVNISHNSTAEISSYNSTELQIVGDCEIYNIAVKKDFQKQGFGVTLLNQIVLIAKGCNIESIWLEVRNSNEQAISFYKKNHFKKIYERKNFYSKPIENATVMKRRLKPQS